MESRQLVYHMMKVAPLSLIFGLCVGELGNKVNTGLCTKEDIIQWFTFLYQLGCNCIIIIALIITKTSNGTCMAVTSQVVGC